ncbi:hypothetical protein TD95_005001 [Thielaviopsis punctulata]|uniref:Uncharacterized protein n=1 Tax=Thielaviopsis punctulata TaxID=72032 RepID=A0A0F4ZC47_9PEZI|nr:hypothetical protein TD95_005001 [Thielaviopsis punctulata]
MPQDPSLYGQRPKKKQRTALPSSSALDFTAQLTSSIAESAASSSSEPTRPRRSGKLADSLFKKASSNATASAAESDKKTLKLKEILQTHEEAKQLDLSRRRLEEKAKIYNALKRNDHVPGKYADSLVDFDRKWAERHASDASHSAPDSDSDSDSSFEQPDDDELVEYIDEFGRSRHVTRAQKRRLDRREMRGLRAERDAQDMSVRAQVPDNLIRGAFIQKNAVQVADVDGMAELAKKRDRSATPPPDTHYNADWEIRDKGVGFYKFSHDKEEREKEMKGLEKDRRETEDKRRAAEEKKKERRREIEERRKQVETRRAKKKADDFLDKLTGNLGP